MTQRPPAGFVRIGRLGRSFKLAGGVRLHLDDPAVLLDSDDDGTAPHPSGLSALGLLFVSGLGETRLRSCELVSGALVVHLEGVRDRTVARGLVNAEVYARLADVPVALAEELTQPAADDELVGLEVRLAGRTIGTVDRAHTGTSNDYVEVGLSGGGTALVPLTAPYVRLAADGIDLLDPPAGLVEP